MKFDKWYKHHFHTHCNYLSRGMPVCVCVRMRFLYLSYRKYIFLGYFCCCLYMHLWLYLYGKPLVHALSHTYLENILDIRHTVLLYALFSERPVISFKVHCNTKLILGLCPANERRCYFVETSLIGWAQAQNQHMSNRPIIRIVSGNDRTNDQGPLLLTQVNCTPNMDN